MKLSIGLAHYDDFDGAYFTIQDIRKELIFNNRQDLLDRIEFVVVENNKTSNHAKELKDFLAKSVAIKKNLNYNIVSNNGTSIVKNQIINNATGDFVLVLDCHVLLCPTVFVIEKIFDFIEKNPESNDLYNGPLVHDNIHGISTHYRNIWRDSSWGVWSTAFRCECENFYFDVDSTADDEEIYFHSIINNNKVSDCPVCKMKLPDNKQEFNNMLSSKSFKIAGMDPNDKPFEIFSQGTGCFLVKKSAWLGYNQHCLGFGGEECYIHEKFRKNGRNTFCLPFLKWLHRFNRVEEVNYPAKLEYKVRNYILEFIELGLDLDPVYKHFVKDLNFDTIVYNSFVRESKYLLEKG